MRNLIAHFRSQGRECEWVEFKCNNDQPEEIAEYISAISNSAAIIGVEFGYLVWGIHDESLEVRGTQFRPMDARKGNEPLINWLIRSTLPQLDFQFFETEIEGLRVVVLRIPKAPNQPVRFGSEVFVRVDSQKRKLKDYPEHARKLWASFDTTTFEAGFALQDVDGPRVLQLIDFSTCFDKLGIALPSDQAGILSRLCDERLVVARPGDRFDVTNLGPFCSLRILAISGVLVASRSVSLSIQGMAGLTLSGNGKTLQRLAATRCPLRLRSLLSIRKLNKTSRSSKRYVPRSRCILRLQFAN